MKDQIEKQAIEEMAKDLCIPIMRFLPWVNCEMCESNGTDIEQCLFHKYAKILTKAGYRKQSELTPCDVCKFNPPSSGDGKPCSMCPAQANMKGGAE